MIRGGEDAAFVGVALSDQPIGRGFEVLQFQLALAADQAVLESEAEAAGAVIIQLRHHAARGGKDMRVPAVAEGVAGRGVRAAVDDVLHGVLLLCIEARRQREPHLHRFA